MSEPQSVPSSRRAGATVGRYTLLADLGQGGMANVYLAVMRGKGGFNKLLVLKMIREHLAHDGELIASFLAEARLAARLSHPNVVQTYEVGEQDGEHVIVMEYLDGAPIHQLVAADKNQTLTRAMCLKIVIDALSGLHHAHELTDYDGTPLGLVHRDVSPHNLFVTFDGQVKVLDFGIAKVVRAPTQTETGVLKGKLHYMAPEQFAGEKLDRRADIYAIGVVLWELATRQRMWKNVQDAAVMYKVLHGEITPVREVSPDVSPELEAVIMKALALRREDRYATCLELQDALERVLRATGERVETRELGGAIAKLLDRVRAERKLVIENQLRRLDELGSGEFSAAQLPTLTVSRTGRSGPRALVDTGGTDPQSVEADSHSGVQRPVAPPPTKRSLARVALPVVGIALASSILVATLMSRRAAPPRVADEARAAATAAAPSPAPPPPAQAPRASDDHGAPDAPRKVTLSLRATPDSARLFLDDRPLSGNPVTEQVVDDGVAHTLRAEARDHLSRTIAITFDRDVDTLIALDRAPRSAPALAGGSRRGAVASAAAAPPTTPVAQGAAPAATAPPSPPPAASAKKNGRSLDSELPW